MIIFNNKNKFSIERIIKYFIIQAIASSILLIRIIIITKIPNNLIVNSSSFILLYNTSLLLKIGIAPFHFWYIEIVESINWITCFLLITWQKLTPLILIIYNLTYNLLLIIIIIINLFLRRIKGINQTRIRKIIAFSSINHLVWIIISIIINEIIWIFYYLLYFISSFIFIKILNKNKIYYISQLLFNQFNLNTKVLYIINIFNFIGFPPLIIFIPKWLIIRTLLFKNIILITLIIIIFTLITMYIYSQLIYNSLLFSRKKSLLIAN